MKEVPLRVGSRIASGASVGDSEKTQLEIDCVVRNTPSPLDVYQAFGIEKRHMGVGVLLSPRVEIYSATDGQSSSGNSGGTFTSSNGSAAIRLRATEFLR